jgi:hypothetical protein
MFRHSMILFACFILLFSALVAALGEKQIVTFPEHTDFTIQEQQPLLTQSNDFIIASSHHRHDRHTPVIIVDPKDDIAIHIAVYTFAEDIEKVTGVKPSVVNATRFSRLAKSDVKSIIVGSVTSGLISAVSGSQEVRNTLKGQWESFDIRVTEQPIKGVSEALVIVGSDRVRPSTLQELKFSEERSMPSTPYPRNLESPLFITLQTLQYPTILPLRSPNTLPSRTVLPPSSTEVFSSMMSILHFGAGRKPISRKTTGSLLYKSSFTRSGLRWYCA